MLKRFGLSARAAAFVCVFAAGGSLFGRTAAIQKAGTIKGSLIADLKAAIPDLITKADIPGLSIAVIRDGILLWSGAFGVKSAQTKEPVTEDTIFEAASLTKPFFAYYAMKLVEAGELDLDKPLVGYIPRDVLVKTYILHPWELEGFRRDWFERITARMALSHSSGLPHGDPRRPLPIFFEPGTKYRYSADGYFYLQRVIEHLKGRPLEALMKEAVIDPLGMTSSSLVWEDRYDALAAVGHDFFGVTDGRFRKRKQAHAAATLYTTAKDYARFVLAVLNDVGLKPETIRGMLGPQIPVAQDLAWSLGFGKQTTPAGQAFWQWGDYGTFRNYIVAYEDSKNAFVYLTNSFNGLSIGREIARRVFGTAKDPALAYLNYAQSDSPGVRFVKASIEKGVAAIPALFKEFREADAQGFNEQTVNWAGYLLLNAKRHREAIAVFELNVEAYPQSANTYDSLSDAYIAAGDKQQAIVYCTKALEAIPLDKNADPAALESLKRTALAKLKNLEKK
jgi:CubicO group peptidase (beta-lactamase class C family)